MERRKFVGLEVFAMLALAALPELACCQLAAPIVYCAAEGRLPDPTDCGYYVDCTKNSDGSYTSTINPCPAGTYYDSCQGDCSKTQQPSVCSFACDNDGIAGFPPENPSVYFVCNTAGSVPTLTVAKCPSGTAIGADMTTCIGIAPDCPVNNESPAPSTCNGTYYYGHANNCSVYYYCSGPGASPEAAYCNADEYFISYNHSCTKFQCTSQGFFADPADCASFYYCVGDASEATQLTCASGTHFDSSVGGCLQGECTTVCPGSSSHFTCPSIGFFADPLNCNWYYYCDSTLQASHSQCPDGSHFDSTVGSCLMGECSSTGTDFTCPSSGIFADTSNCNWYYYCDSSLQASHSKCPDGSHFDSTLGGCLMGEYPSRLVGMDRDVGVRPLRSVSSLSLRREETQIPFWNSRKGTLQMPSP
ncbi:peritrophin-48-like isoform X1 [Schistocerca nitens]|uniref:peritrophin-48-like isoform X1 n=1 Tax=Schistocerca nitens TaxID=7011 RepID=UPI0021193C1F|nr:peritrophin-48-like isoform X1 [Schistocerca nitens]